MCCYLWYYLGYMRFTLRQRGNQPEIILYFQVAHNFFHVSMMLSYFHLLVRKSGDCLRLMNQLGRNPLIQFDNWMVCQTQNIYQILKQKNNINSQLYFRLESVSLSCTLPTPSDFAIQICCIGCLRFFRNIQAAGKTPFTTA